MAINQWHYLGDGIYFQYDGYGVWLHANSHDNPTDRIYLEPSVFIALGKLYKKEIEGDATT